MESTPVINQNSAMTENNYVKIQIEIQDMLKFVYNNGMKIPESISEASLNNIYNTTGITDILIADYNSLVGVIAPTTPESIRFIYSQSTKSEKGSLFNMPIFLKYSLLAVFGLFTLIIISLFPQVNAENLEKGILSSSGPVLLYNLIFVCSSALLGVMFYVLKFLKDQIESYTLRPVNVLEINTTIIIGVISGFIISELFTFNAGVLGGSIEVHKMTLALIGGFSADAIFTVLQGIVNKLKMLVTS